jgi:hypothetical protein
MTTAPERHPAGRSHLVILNFAKGRIRAQRAIGQDVDPCPTLEVDRDVAEAKADSSSPTTPGGGTVGQKPAPQSRQRLTDPRSPRLRNPDQLRRGERYGSACHKGGSVFHVA